MGTGRTHTFLTVWAIAWSALIAVLFVGVTALTVTLWFTDPDYTETTPVSDLSCEE